jgi:hypothetical protein
VVEEAGENHTEYITKKGALDSQPHVIKFTSCLAKFGGSLWVLPTSFTTKTGHHDIAGILLKVALNTKNQISPISPVLNVFLTQNK